MYRDACRTCAGWSRLAAALAVMLCLAGCSSGTFNVSNPFSGGASAPASQPTLSAQPLPAIPPNAMGASPGTVKIGLLLPLSAAGNAGAASVAMRNAAEMAIVELHSSVQLTVKDDGATAMGAQRAAQQAIDEGAGILLGPLFAQSVGGARQVAQSRGVPMIAFSTDTNVAAPGAFLLSFLPESEVDRIVTYAVSQGKKSLLAMLPSNAYGSVVEAEFQQAAGRRGARVVALEHYSEGHIADAVRPIIAAAGSADALLIADTGGPVGEVVDALAAGGVNLHRLTLLGTALWDDPRVFANPALQGGWYAAPDPSGFHAFAERYRSHYDQDPPHPAALAYDAVALIAALAAAPGGVPFTNERLTNPSGFTGIDGLFRLRPDGTNQRGLAVLRVTRSGGEVIAPALRSFSGSGI
jgi:branched-chain amino acid transport system substrate-binding protein